MASSSASPTTTPLQQHLDKSKLSKEYPLLALCIPLRKLSLFMRAHKTHQLSLPRIRAVRVDDERKDAKLVLLKQEYTSVDTLPDDLRTLMVDNNDISVKPYTLRLGYDDMTYEEVMKAILPDGVPVPNSFETVGHVAHLNLRDTYTPYKYVIGQILIEKLTTIRTVVTKVGTVSNEYRVFDREVLAGEPDFNVEVKQHGCVFRFDYSKVYWNSRLEGEHIRLVETFSSDDVICDMMAGVGPFAVPAAKTRGCRVYANDLNPDSYKYLCENIQGNHVQSLVAAYNMDGREFVRTVARQLPITQVIMNLPASALEFIDVLAAGFAQTTPLVHCYTFCAGESDHDRIREYVRTVIGDRVGNVDVRFVRRVAPNKEMVCAEFRLPAAVADNNDDDAKEPQLKKPRH